MARHAAILEKPPQDPSARKEWVAEKVLDSIFDHDLINLDYQVPSQKELNQLKQEVSLEKVYPPFMNNIMEFGPDTYTANLLYFSDELKDLGINTFTIMPLYHLKNGKLEFFFSNTSGSPELLSSNQAKRAIAHSIIMAKQLGFTVIMTPDYFDLEGGGLKKLKDPNNFEDELERVILELAPIAEEYGVEYLTLANNIGASMADSGYEIDEIIKRTNAYNAKVGPSRLPKPNQRPLRLRLRDSYSQLTPRRPSLPLIPRQQNLRYSQKITPHGRRS